MPSVASKNPPQRRHVALDDYDVEDSDDPFGSDTEPSSSKKRKTKPEAKPVGDGLDEINLKKAKKVREPAVKLDEDR